MKKLILTFVVLAALIPASANANDAKSAVTDQRGNKVLNVLTKNCVRHDWVDGTDPCAPAPEPEVYVAPEPAPEPIAMLSKEELTVYFDFNKSTLTPDSTIKLNNLVQALLASEGVESLAIVGYADRIGSTDYNQKLSAKRTMSVENYINSKVNIPTSVVQADSRGESNSVTSCEGNGRSQALISCLAADRRVEIVLNYFK